jgi:hypothetical protein
MNNRVPNEIVKVILAVIIVMTAYLLVSDGGLWTSGWGVDGAHHLALAETLLAGKDPALHPDNLGEMAFYPRGSHYITACFSRLTGIAPPHAMSIVAAFCCILGLASWTARALRWMKICRVEDRSQSLSVILSLIFWVVLSMWHVGIPGHIACNFFFPQLVGAGLAYFALYVLEGVRPAWLTALLGLTAAILLNEVHPIGSLWLMGSVFILILQKARSPLTGMALAISILIAFCVALRLSPSFAAMNQIAANNGALVLLDIVVTNNRTFVECACVLFGFILICAVVNRCSRQSIWGMLLRPPAHMAGYISATCLMILQLLALIVLHKGSTYAVAKWLYLVVPETFFVLLPIYSGSVADSTSNATETPERKRGILNAVYGMPLLLGLMVIQFPWFPWNSMCFNLQPLVEARQRTLHLRDTTSPSPETGYPQFKHLPNWANYYLAIGLLEYPKDLRTMNWLIGGDCRTERSLLLERLPIPADGLLKFSAKGNASPYLESGWNVPEQLGCWTEGLASLAFKINRPGRLRFRFLSVAIPSFPVKTVTFSVNGNVAATWVRGKGDSVPGTEPVVIDVPVTPDVTGTARLEISVHDPVVPAEANIGSPDLRSLGIYVFDGALLAENGQVDGCLHEAPHGDSASAAGRQITK